MSLLKFYAIFFGVILIILMFTVSDVRRVVFKIIGILFCAGAGIGAIYFFLLAIPNLLHFAIFTCIGCLVAAWILGMLAYVTGRGVIASGD